MSGTAPMARSTSPITTRSTGSAQLAHDLAPPFNPVPVTARILQVVRQLAIAATVLAGLLLSARFVWAGVRSVSLPWPITHPEGATIAAMLRVRDGEALYQGFQSYPYLITPYPPVQPVMV